MSVIIPSHSVSVGEKNIHARKMERENVRSDEKLQAELLAEYSNYEYSDDREKEKTSDIRTSALILISLIWIQGFRANSNLMYIPQEQQIYCANGFIKSDGALRFRCYCEGCDAKVYLQQNGSATQPPNQTHNHGSQYRVFKEMECINEMKKMCLSAPASMTTREIYDESVRKYV